LEGLSSTWLHLVWRFLVVCSDPWVWIQLGQREAELLSLILAAGFTSSCCCFPVRRGCFSPAFTQRLWTPVDESCCRSLQALSLLLRVGGAAAQIQRVVVARSGSFGLFFFVNASDYRTWITPQSLLKLERGLEGQMVQRTWGPTGKPAALAEMSSSGLCVLPVGAHTSACNEKAGDTLPRHFPLAKAPAVLQGHFQAASLGCRREAAALPSPAASWWSDYRLTAEGESTRNLHAVEIPCRRQRGSWVAGPEEGRREPLGMERALLLGNTRPGMPPCSHRVGLHLWRFAASSQNWVCRELYLQIWDEGAVLHWRAATARVGPSAYPENDSGLVPVI